MKTDHRTRYTRKVICESFLEILETTPIQRITVKAMNLSNVSWSTIFMMQNDHKNLLTKVK